MNKFSVRVLSYAPRPPELPTDSRSNLSQLPDCHCGASRLVQIQLIFKMLLPTQFFVLSEGRGNTGFGRH